MRAAFRHSSFVIRHLPLLALALLAIYPILASGLPTTGDGLIHYYRFAELDWHIRHGDLYPRWFDNMGYGFGMPVLNFYAPLSYYIPLLFRLFNLSLATSLQLGYALALALALLGAHQWASALTTQPPNHRTTQPPSHLTALLAAAAYGLAPYFYFNIFHRGAYPETWALALAPWLLWSAHKLAEQPTALRSSLFTVLLSALILTHTLSALIFIPIISVYLIALSITHNLVARRLSFTAKPSFRIVHRSSLIVYPFALSAFFILPLAFESQFIQLSRAFSTGDLDYHRNFLKLAALLSSPPNFDPRLVFNAIPPSLGWPQLLLALSAVGGWLFAARRKSPLASRSLFIVHCSLFILLSLLALSITEPLWNLFPFARFIQFPWRLIGPASLFLAALASNSPISNLNSQTSKTLFLSASIAAFFFFSLPWTYHADFALHAPPSTPHAPTDTIRYETTSGQLGAASTAEYLPRWVAAIPDPNTLLPQFAATETPSRLAPLPESVSLHASRFTLHAQEIIYDSASSFTAAFNLFYFPGWAATLDGDPIGIQPSSPHGLITVALPAGTHTLRLSLQPTAPQRIGVLVSLAALLILILRLVRRPSSTAHRSPPANRQSPITNYQPPIIVSLFIASLLLARALYFDRAETIFHHTDVIPNPLSVNIEDQLELLGYEFPKGTQFASDSQLPITLYWRALAPLTTDYSTTVQLADRFGNRFGQSDSQHPNGVPTSRWALNQYARDSHTLVPLIGAPPGVYKLLITVYASRPLSILQDSAPAGIEYELGAVTITRGQPQPPGPLTLTDSDLATDSVSVGDQLAFTLLWNSGDKPLPVLTARVLLADSADQTIFSADLPPSGEDYPTSQWALNELVRFPFSVGLPPDLPGGAARVRILLLDANGMIWAGPFDIGMITIAVPERSYIIPPMQVRVDHDFAKAIRLLGYDLAPDSITLYWQSLAPVAQRLTAFVHRLDDSGAFVAGHDAPPSRPATGWLPGEVVADSHPISAGERFEIGLYDPMTGERFGEVFVTPR
ncbi:MAG: hypothetical protein FJ030_05895 [Chloroflexi bacterium]|nr:hypothetical protein [Chloroflexota bacterium]